MEGIPEGVSIGTTDNPLARFLIRGGLELYLGLNATAVQQYRASADTFKANYIGTPCHTIYSHTDPVTDSNTIESVIQGWADAGFDSTCTVYEGSTHVQHMRKHREQYFADLQQFCSKVFTDENFPSRTP